MGNLETDTNDKEEKLQLDKFSEAIVRFYFRSTIFELLKHGSRLDEIRNALLNKNEVEKKIFAVVSKLKEKVVIPNPEVAQILETAGLEIQQTCPHIKDLGIILMGSNGHVGHLFREALGIDASESDVDWGFVCSNTNQLDPGTLNQLFQIVDNYLVGGGYRSCNSLNGSRKKYDSFVSATECFNWLMSTTNLDETSYTLTQLLKPTYPNNVWKLNANIVFKTLRYICVTNRPYWEELIDAVCETWPGWHHIKSKHLGVVDDNAYELTISRAGSDIIRDINSSKPIAAPFTQLLKDTGDSNIPISELVSRLTE